MLSTFNTGLFLSDTKTSESQETVKIKDEVDEIVNQLKSTFLSNAIYRKSVTDIKKLEENQKSIFEKLYESIGNTDAAMLSLIEYMNTSPVSGRQLNALLFSKASTSSSSPSTESETYHVLSKGDGVHVRYWGRKADLNGRTVPEGHRIICINLRDEVSTYTSKFKRKSFDVFQRGEMVHWKGKTVSIARLVGFEFCRKLFVIDFITDKNGIADPRSQSRKRKVISASEIK